jgi:hypothetical protein
MLRTRCSCVVFLASGLSKILIFYTSFPSILLFIPFVVPSVPSRPTFHPLGPH